MAIVNAKNGLAVAAAALALGQGIAQGINAIRAKAQSKRLAEEITPELARLQEQLNQSQTALRDLQGQPKSMGESAAIANRTRIKWSIASFCLGLIPFSLKTLGAI